MPSPAGPWSRRDNFGLQEHQKLVALANTVSAFHATGDLTVDQQANATTINDERRFRVVDHRIAVIQTTPAGYPAFTDPRYYVTCQYANSGTSGALTNSTAMTLLAEDDDEIPEAGFDSTGEDVNGPDLIAINLAEIADPTAVPPSGTHCLNEGVTTVLIFALLDRINGITRWFFSEYPPSFPARIESFGNAHVGTGTNSSAVGWRYGWIALALDTTGYAPNNGTGGRHGLNLANGGNYAVNATDNNGAQTGVVAPGDVVWLGPTVRMPGNTNTIAPYTFCAPASSALLVITGRTQDGTNQRWVYNVGPAAKTATGYGTWNHGYNLTASAYNTAETINHGTNSLFGNGVSGTSLTGSFALQPVPTGIPVQCTAYGVPNGTNAGTLEWWFTFPNGIDGGCT